MGAQTQKAFDYVYQIQAINRPTIHYELGNNTGEELAAMVLRRSSLYLNAQGTA